MRGSGGTEGGMYQFLIGFALAMLGLYLFLDSVRVTTDGGGIFSGALRGRGGMWETTSMGIIFVPFFLGVLALFYDSKLKWAWILMGLGVVVIVIEILSRIRFLINTKTTHLLGMIVLFAAGAGLMLRSYRDYSDAGDKPNESET